MVIALSLVSCSERERERENRSSELPSVGLALLPDCPEPKPQTRKLNEGGVRVLPNRIMGPDGCPVEFAPLKVKPIPSRKERGLFGTESGYLAGRDWAEENMITDESECYSPSSSFEHGCLEFVEEQGAEPKK